MANIGQYHSLLANITYVGQYHSLLQYCACMEIQAGMMYLARCRNLVYDDADCRPAIKRLFHDLYAPN